MGYELEVNPDVIAYCTKHSIYLVLLSFMDGMNLTEKFMMEEIDESRSVKLLRPDALNRVPTRNLTP